MELQYFEFIKHLARPRRQVYLDHNATTPVSDSVRRQMDRVLARHYGNPSSFYGAGRKAGELIGQARERVAAAIGARAAEIYFTGSATESNNAVIHSVGARALAEGLKIVSTLIEHPSVMAALASQASQGVRVEYCPVDRHGRVVLAELANLVDARTALVCCALANNEIGVVQDMQAIAGIARQHGALVLMDGAQALGKIPVNVRKLDVDFASFSAHKLYGPKGVGALYVRQGIVFTPLLMGGHQENGMRAGTEGVHNIVGFGVACQNTGKLLANSNRLMKLSRLLIRRLKQIAPECVINSPDEGRLPNTVSITFPGVSAAELMAMLDYHGIAVSGGSACSSGADTPSHVLTAIGLSDRGARGTIRFSLGVRTTPADIIYTADTIRDFLEDRLPQVQMLTPAQLNESILFDEQTFILDVRPPEDRHRAKGLPNAHEVSPLFVERYLGQLPRDKRILVYCPGGGLSLMISYYLKAKGFKRVVNLRGGLDAWRARRGDLYRQYAGQNVTVLQPDAAE